MREPRHGLPPCDHDECPPTRCVRLAGDFSPSPVRHIDLSDKESIVELMFAVQTGHTSCRRAASDIQAAMRLMLDPDKIIAACVPGGDICDPQHVADALREYILSNAASEMPTERK